MSSLVAYTKGPLLLQGRDPDGRVMVLERSEENPQLTWIWTHTLRIPPSSTLCGALPGINYSTTVLPHVRMQTGQGTADAQNRRKGLEGAKAKLMFGKCFLILMLPRIIKNASPWAHLKNSHWEAGAKAGPQHCKQSYL